MRINDEAMYLDVVRDERVVYDGFYCFADGLFSVAKAVEPFLEIDTTIAYHVDGFLVDAACLHVLYHLLGTHVAGTAIAVSYYHHVRYSQFKDRYQQAADNTTERVGDDASGILYHFYITILYTQCGR